MFPRRRSSLFTLSYDNISLFDGFEDDELKADEIDSFFTGKEIVISTQQEQQQQQSRPKDNDDQLRTPKPRRETATAASSSSSANNDTTNQQQQVQDNNGDDDDGDNLLGSMNRVTPDHSPRSLTPNDDDCNNDNKNDIVHNHDRNRTTSTRHQHDQQQQRYSQDQIQTSIDEWNAYYNNTQVELQLEFQRTLKKLEKSMRRTEESRTIVKRQRMCSNNSGSSNYSSNNYYNDYELDYSRRCIQELIRKETHGYNNNNYNNAMYYR